MSKPLKKTPIQMPSLAEDRKITAAAKADPDAQPLTNKELAAMVPAHALRGRPPSANRKQLVSVRYSPEVIEFFRSTGEGWQSRMDGVLKQYVEAQVQRRPPEPSCIFQKKSSKPVEIELHRATTWLLQPSRRRFESLRAASR